MSNPRQNILNQKLILSAQLGDKDGVLSHLAQGGNPQAKDSTALREAAYHGHAECVKILISVSDPKILDSQALRFAVVSGHADSDPTPLLSRPLSGIERLVDQPSAASGLTLAPCREMMEGPT